MKNDDRLQMKEDFFLEEPDELKKILILIIEIRWRFESGSTSTFDLYFLCFIEPHNKLLNPSVRFVIVWESRESRLSHLIFIQNRIEYS